MPIDIQIDISYGGFFSGDDILKGNSNRLSLYIKKHPFPEMEPVYIHPSVEEFQKFIECIRKIKWKPKYYSAVLDGIQWEVKIKAGEIKINSYGSNSYPPGFADFIKSVRELSKCPEFADGCEEDMKRWVK